MVLYGMSGKDLEKVRMSEIRILQLKHSSTKALVEICLVCEGDTGSGGPSRMREGTGGKGEAGLDRG